MSYRSVLGSTSVISTGIGTFLSTSNATSQISVECQTVQLSTRDGVECDCGKFAIDAQSLQIKQMTLGEVRQIVASAYKLAHGGPLGTIQWK